MFGKLHSASICLLFSLIQTIRRFPCSLNSERWIWVICLLCFGQVQLPSTGSAGDHVHCPDNNFVPLAHSDAYICMKFIRTKRGSHVNGTGSLKRYGGVFCLFCLTDFQHSFILFLKQNKIIISKLLVQKPLSCLFLFHNSCKHQDREWKTIVK